MFGTAIKNGMIWIDEEDLRNVEKFKALLTYRPKYENLQPVPVYKYDDKRGKYGFPRNIDYEADSNIDYETDSRAVALRALVSVAAVYHAGAGRYFLDLLSVLFHSVSVSFTVPTNSLVNIDAVCGNVFTPI